MIEHDLTINKNIKLIRIVTTILIIIPILLLLLVAINNVFLGLFFVMLFPVSFLILVMHFFLGKLRRKNNLIINEWDNIKIFIGIVGLIVGLVLWCYMYVILY